MLHEKIDLLMNALNAGSIDLARLTNHSPTSFSRLRSGSRAPQPNSPTIRNFAEGIVLFANETGQTEKICSLIQCEFPEKLAPQIVKWLYSDESAKPLHDNIDRAEQFGKRLHLLMEIAGMNNRALAEHSDTEYSYISRLHRGERFPKSGSESLNRICTALFDEIQNSGKLHELSERTAIPPEYISFSIVRDWLCGFMDNIDIVSVRRLIGNIEKITPDLKAIPPMAELPEIIISDYYIGDIGLQNAVIRFLSSTQKGQELWLYSDSPMNWMTGEYQLLWASLMFRCLKMGTSIKIIHNIDRNISEMLTAIQSWMPLYLTGLIQPFYCLKERGERFQHTLFLCPEHSAISGYAPNGAECEYHYLTDPARLEHLKTTFLCLLEDSRPLLTVSLSPQSLEGTFLSRTFGNAEALANKECAIVNQLTEPFFSFRFLHPSIVETFRLLLR